jgi:hypothetical protein
MVGFVVGLVVAAILQVHFGLWSIGFPLSLAVMSIPLGETWCTPGTEQDKSACRV